MKNLTTILPLLGLFLAASAVASKYQARTCNLDHSQGSGQMGIRAGADWVTIDAKETDGGYLPIAFSNALAELGVIESLDVVTALSYFPKAQNCTKDESLREVTCQENTAEIGLTTVRTDSQGVTHERKRKVTLDGIRVAIHSGQQGATWDWSWIQGAKRTGLNGMKLLSCLYGEEN